MAEAGGIDEAWVGIVVVLVGASNTDDAYVGIVVVVEVVSRPDGV